MSVSNRLVPDGGAILEKGRLCITVQLASTERSHALMGQQCRRVREVPGRRVFQSAIPIKNSRHRHPCELTHGMRRPSDGPFASIRVHSRLFIRVHSRLFLF
jgi:hypothetical protein